MSNVFHLNSNKVNANEILENAKDKYENVFIIGIRSNGDVYIAGSNDSIATNLLYLEMGKIKLLNMVQGNE